MVSTLRSIRLNGGNKYVTGSVYLVVGIFTLMSSLNLAGTIGQVFFNHILLLIVGYGFLIMAPILILTGVWILREREISIRDGISMFALFLSLNALVDIFFSREGLDAGGFVGRLVGSNMVAGFDVYFSSILLGAIAIVSGFLIFDPHFRAFKRIKEEIEERIEERAEEREDEKKIEEEVNKALEASEEDIEDDEEEEPAPKKSKKKRTSNDEDDLAMNTSIFASSYTPPPLSLLGVSSGKPSTGDIKANANIIQRTLANFGIAVEMDEISIGPTVTRYAMKPAQGVRLSKIASLQNELALALAAKSIRIEAPIPGRSLVGVEVPNTQKSTIGLGSILAEEEYRDPSKPLLVALGKGVSGRSYFANIGKMPHALIAGATGAGKSVTIHNIVMSLLYKNGPDMLRFIMVDPKRVEMTLYKKIPHLLTPVITDPKKAVLALKWAVKEMERRYDVLQSHASRDINSYHGSIVAPAYKNLSPEDIEDMADDLPEKMPYIIVIIDELSDIMSAYPRELEASIVRLAQMSRAVGIHLLLATQRPDVSVITGLIKANIPTRIALKVASQIDSRTILDGRGAEKLLGYGDMLYKGEGANEPVRVQSPFVSEDEVKKVVSHIQKNYKFELDDTISLPDEQLQDGGGGVSLADGESDDPLLEDARTVVIESGKASTSYLQRRLSIGYSRAARIMDMLEEAGIIGPQNGSKPREVLVGADEEEAEDEMEDDEE